MFRSQIDYRTSGFRIWLFARSRQANYGPLGALAVLLGVTAVTTAAFVGYARLLGAPDGDMPLALAASLTVGVVLGLFLSAVHVAGPGIDDSYEYLQRAMRFGYVDAGRGNTGARADLLDGIARWQGYTDGRPRGFAAN